MMPSPRQRPLFGEGTAILRTRRPKQKPSSKFSKPSAFSNSTRCSPFDPYSTPQADAEVSAVIEKTLYEKDWPDSAVAKFIIDDLRKAGFEIVRIFRNTP
jgi:hypothetical protein